MRNLFAAAMLSVACLGAQAAPAPDWDLSYEAVLSAQAGTRRDDLRRWARAREARPATKLLAGYRGEPIEQSVLIESAAEGGASSGALWLYKTPGKAMACNAYRNLPENPCTEMGAAVVDGMIRHIQQYLQRNQSATQDVSADEQNFAFLNLYVDGVSSQRLVGIRELVSLSEALNNYMRSAGSAAPAAHSGAGQEQAQPAPVTAAPEVGSYSSPEETVRQGISSATWSALERGDVVALERFYREYKGKRTPSGTWKQYWYFEEFRKYGGRSRDKAHWDAKHALATAWRTKYPRSAAARILDHYLYISEAWSTRGNGSYANIPAEDIRSVDDQMRKAGLILSADRTERRMEPEPEYQRIPILQAPLTSEIHNLDLKLNSLLDKAPDYHPGFFDAAALRQVKWGGGTDGIERVARKAASGTGKDARAMYARVYWYADQVVYSGKIFERSPVVWADMKTSFDALVKTYPDPWNLNAFADFACRKGDLDTAGALLKRLGDKVYFGAWQGGKPAYQNCSRALDAAAVQEAR